MIAPSATNRGGGLYSAGSRHTGGIHVLMGDGIVMFGDLNSLDAIRTHDTLAESSKLDALTYAGVYEDDCQIDRLIVERGEVVAGGNVVVEIRFGLSLFSVN